MHGYLSADIICSMQDTNRAKLEEKCERETDNVQGQISVRIFRQLEAIVLLSSKYFAKRVKKYIYEQLTVCCLAWFPVRLYEQNNVHLLL